MNDETSELRRQSRDRILKGGMGKLELIGHCAAEKTVVVVVSAGDWAASPLADLLATLGCDAPPSQREGASKISDLNAAVLESSGTSMYDWAGFNTQWLSSPKATEFLGRALDLFQAEYGGSYLSVMHGAGIALLLPFWNIVFDRAAVVPRYLIVTSDPVELAEELSQRSGFEPRGGHLVWLRAMLDAEANSRGKLRAFADVAKLSREPARVFKSFGKSLELTFPRDLQTAFASRDSRLKQFREFVQLSKEAAINAPPATAAVDWVTATHQILHHWTSHGETADGRTVLDAIREAFEEAAPAFVGLGRSAGQNGTGLAPDKQDLDTEVEELRKANAATEEALEEAEEQLRARYSEIVTLTRMLATETAAARKFERSATKLGGIAQALQAGTGGRGVAKWLRSLLPWGWNMHRAMRRIEREGLFDARAYLDANPDVESAGVDPLKHYLTHGASEGRPLGNE